MYNELQKREYIEYALNRNRNAESLLRPIFNATEEIEDRIKKDACDFSVRDIIEFLRTLYTPSLSRLKNIESQLKLYAAWCKDNSLIIDNQNHYEEIDKAMLLSCLNKGMNDYKILSKQELNNLMNVVKNTRDKVILLGIFEGICDTNLKSLREATKHNIDADKNEFIMDDGRRIKISSRLVGLMLDSIDEMTFLSHSEKVFTFKPGTEPYVLKSCSSKTDSPYLSIRSIENVFNNYRDYALLTITGLKVSGMLNMINELYTNGNYENISQCIYDNYDNITYIYGTFVRDDILQLYNDMFEA